MKQWLMKLKGHFANFFAVLVAVTVFACSSTFAQSEIVCALPPDTIPVEDPEIDAEQAGESESNLAEFTREVRDWLKFYRRAATVSFTKMAYFACNLRREDGPWRTDTVYPILVSPFGRVFMHSKDMFLAGRLVDPDIMDNVYSALGVPAGVIADLRSTDPATVASARRAIVRVFAKEPDAQFDATASGIPGAQGHAAVFASRATQRSILVFGGFDLDNTHVVDEVLDYGNPTITAREIVNRETLEAFVNEAGRFYTDSIANSGESAFASLTQVALRDANGPWRDGSVYLYVLDIESNIILLHGSNPTRFEWLPLIPTVRDAVTGELVLPQIIEAAKSNPEGGFVRYYFDDPTVDTDNADTPKVGFARQFTASRQRADGSVVNRNFIIGSGFYLTSPAVAALRQNTVVQTVLPQIMRTMTASTTEAVSERVQQVISGTPDTLTHTTLPTLTDLVFAMGSQSIDSKRWLEEMSFAYPVTSLNDGSEDSGGITFWGSADFRKLSHDNMAAVSYDGGVTSAIFGVDQLFGENLVGGVSLNASRGSTDYTDAELMEGTFKTTLTSINPYMGWELSENSHVWGTAGFGTGQIEFKEAANSQSSDWSQSMFAGGISYELLSNEQILAGGTTGLNFKG